MTVQRRNETKTTTIQKNLRSMIPIDESAHVLASQYVDSQSMIGTDVFPGRLEIPQGRREFTGFSAGNEHPDQELRVASGRPLSISWITDDLLQYTREVWSKAYGRPVSEDEAVEMLLNIKRLGEVTLKSTKAKGGH